MEIARIKESDNMLDSANLIACLCTCKFVWLPKQTLDPFLKTSFVPHYGLYTKKVQAKAGVTGLAEVMRVIRVQLW